MEIIKTRKAKNGESKTKAYVTVRENSLVVRFNVVENAGKYYLNSPASFVESLKGKEFNGKKHTGFIEHAHIENKAEKQRILEEALKELRLW